MTSAMTPFEGVSANRSMTAPRPSPDDSPPDLFRRPRCRPARQRFGPSAADPFPIPCACLRDGYSYQPRLYHALSSCISPYYREILRIVNGLWAECSGFPGKQGKDGREMFRNPGQAAGHILAYQKGGGAVCFGEGGTASSVSLPSPWGPESSSRLFFQRGC